MFKIPFLSLPLKSNKSQTDHCYFGILFKEDKADCFLIKQNLTKFEIKDEILITYSNGWENLTEDVDEAISLLEQRNKVKLQQTIIFLYSHFIDETTAKIKSLYFEKIKYLLKNLELKPLGYIECYEGIIEALKSSEGLIVNAILLEVDLTQLTLFIFKNSRKVFSQVIPRTDKITNDILQGLMKLPEKILLPSRMLIYDSGDLHNEVSQIISYSWPEEYFIQPPKVEIINQSKLKDQLIKVFENQMREEEKIPLEPDTKPTKTEEERERLGFKIGQDIAEIEKNSTLTKQQSPFIFTLFKFDLSQLNGFRAVGNWRGKVYSLLGFLIIIGVLVLNEYFLHKAEIIVYLPSQTIEKTITLNKEDLKIATFSGEVEVTRMTTGQKEVGEKARGEITLYNYDDQPKVFAKGTTVSLDNHDYTLEDEVKVEAAKIAEDMAKIPGKNKGQIKASNIGAEYNVEKGKKFKVENTSYFGINETAISGGSKKTIKVVAKKDWEELKAEALKQAQQQKNSLIKLAPGEKVIDDLIAIDLDNLQYSKEIGEEGDNLSLTAKTIVTVYYYKDIQMLHTLQARIQGEVKSDYKLIVDKINFQLEKIEKDTLYLYLKAKALKNVDKQTVKRNVIFKNKNQLDLLLKNKFSAKKVVVEIKQPLPFFKNFTSPFGKNNTIELIDN